MRWPGLIAYAVCMVSGAALIPALSRHSEPLATLGSYEAVHIAAHVCLYGALALLARSRGLAALHAALLALGVGVLQEGVQVVAAGRGPGGSELFDLVVDAGAIIAMLAAARLLREAGRSPRPDRLPAVARE